MGSKDWTENALYLSKLEEIDELKRMVQWKSVIAFLMEIKSAIIRKLEVSWSHDDIMLLSAELRAITKIINPLILPPIDRS